MTPSQIDTIKRIAAHYRESDWHGWAHGLETALTHLDRKPRNFEEAKTMLVVHRVLSHIDDPSLSIQEEDTLIVLRDTLETHLSLLLTKDQS